MSSLNKGTIKQKIHFSTMTFFKIYVKQKICTQLINKRYTQTGGLEPKSVLKLFLGSLLETRMSAVGHFVQYLVKVPEVFAKLIWPIFLTVFKVANCCRRKAMSSSRFLGRGVIGVG